MARQEQTVVGETPNLAARLQAIAAPGSVVISQATRRLVGGLFELADLGPQAEGLAAGALAVEGEGRAEGRFEALHGEHLTPLVGASRSWAFFWSAGPGPGRRGPGGSRGEPGIGKSRIIGAARTLGGRAAHPTRHYCSPYHTNSALYPVIDLLERAAQFNRDDSPEKRLAKLEACRAASDRLDEVVPLIAALLGVPTREHYPRWLTSPRSAEAADLQALVDQLAGLAAQPVLLLRGRALDRPSTWNCSAWCRAGPRLPVLVVTSFRPEFQPPWPPPARNRADDRPARPAPGRRSDSGSAARSPSGGVVAQIVARTDGVPLFVEELTKAVLEIGPAYRCRRSLRARARRRSRSRRRCTTR